MLKTLIEKFPQKKNASFDFIGAIISIFSAENFFLNEFTNFHRPSSHLYPGRSSIGISASKLQKHGAYQVETSVSTQLTPPNFDRGGVYYVGSMPIHHALQVSALLREGMFRGYL